MITLEMLKEHEACKTGIEQFEKLFGNSATNEDIINCSKEIDYEYISWLIDEFEYCQTAEIVEYYKSLNPRYADVSCLIRYCKYCQSEEMLYYYKSLNPTLGNTLWLIRECQYCQREETKEILLEGLEDEN